MFSRGRLVSGSLALGAAACAATAAWWWLDVDRSAFYTDGQAFRAPLPGHAPRDVLWQPPAAVKTLEGDPILALDVFVAPDETTLVLARRSPRGDTDLYISQRAEAGWPAPQPLVAVNSLDNDLSPTLSPDGQRLFFASDRPGGAGGLDIWSCERTATGWSSPTPAECNSAADDTDPHLGQDPTDGSPLLLFSSDRPTTDPGEREQGFSIYAQPTVGDPFLVRASPPGVTLADPALTPSGDFLYWIASPIASEGKPALLRERAAWRPQTTGTAPVHTDTPEVMDASIAALPHVASPSLSLEGFALHLLAGGADEPHLVRAVAREVYLIRASSRSDLIRLVPWMLIALAAVLLLSLLRRGTTSVRWNAALGTLGLLARCALVSLVLHAALVALLTVLSVFEDSGEPSASSTGRVALSSSSVRAALADQLRTLSPSEGTSQPRAPVSVTLAEWSAPSTPEFARTVPTLNSARPAIVSQPQPMPDAPVNTSAITPAVIASAPATDVMPTAPMEPRIPIPVRSASRVTAEPGMASLSRAAVERSPAPIPAVTRDGLPLPPPRVDPGSQRAQIDPELAAAAAEASPVWTADISGAFGTLPDSIAASPMRAPAITLPSAEATPRGRGEPPDADTKSLLTERMDVDLPATMLPAVAASVRPTSAPKSLSGEPASLMAQTSIADAHTQPVTIPLPEFALDLPAAAPSLDGLVLPRVIDLSFDLVGVVVDEQTAQPIAGATVRLDLAAEDDAMATTKPDGSFGLSFQQMPDNAAVTATMPGYAPGALNISATQIDTGKRVTIRLSKIDPFLITLESQPEVHHLGDDAFTGRINSQFQRASEGLSLRFTFALDEGHTRLPARGVELRVFAKGTQLNNPVLVNGTRIAVFDDSPSDGSFGEQRFAVPVGLLQLGENTVEFRSVDSRGTDHDDYEFVNPRIVFLPITDGPV